jgi:hypothetical protein
MESIDGRKGSGLLGLFSGRVKHGDIATYRKRKLSLRRRETS